MDPRESSKFEDIFSGVGGGGGDFLEIQSLIILIPGNNPKKYLDFIRAKQVAAKRQPVELQVGNVCENLLIPLPRNRFFHCKIRKNG